MSKNELDEALEIIDNEVKKVGLSRRDALKLAGLSTTAALMGSTQAQANTQASASEAKGKILIIGGGLAGVSTAARLTSTLTNPDITIVEPNPKSVCYQPGYTLIGGGIYNRDDVAYDTKDFLPSGVEMILDSAAEFMPEQNTVVLTSGKKLTYDYLIVCTGVSLDYGRIKGLEAIGQTYSSVDGMKINETFGDSGACSIYNIDSSVHTWEQVNKLIEKAKKGKVKALFTDPNTPIKCGGAPKKIMYLVNSRLEEAGVKDNVEMHYFDDSSKYFGVKEYADAIDSQFKTRNFKTHFKHNLVGVDLAGKVATFEKKWEEKGEYDEDLEEYEMITKTEEVKHDFDFIHITPPQKAVDAVAKSAIGSGKGWVPVNQETLQHVKYPNVFSLGDTAAVKMGKTGGTVRKQYKVLVDNLVAVMEGKEPKAKFDGYTVCPLITGIGTVMLAEFNWTGKPAPSFPLDPTVERYIWWLLKVYLLKPMTQYGMLSGKA